MTSPREPITPHVTEEYKFQWQEIQMINLLTSLIIFGVHITCIDKTQNADLLRNKTQKCIFSHFSVSWKKLNLAKIKWKTQIGTGCIEHGNVKY